MAWTQEKIDKIYLEIQRAAVVDEEFRKELLNDPKKVIEKYADEPLPEGFNVKVIENDPKYAATFVLPPLASEVLGDDELDAISGGACAANACAAEGCFSQMTK